MDFAATNFQLMAPELFLCFSALVILILDFVVIKGSRRWIGVLSLITAIALLIVVICGGSDTESAFFGLYLQDPVSIVFKIVLGLCAIFILVMSMAYSERIKAFQGEFYILTLFALLGMFLMVSAADFMSLYVSLELTAITFYVLTAYLRDNSFSLESGIKYLILGAVASAFLLYGISYIYGVTGSTNFAETASAVRAMDTYPVTLKLGMVMVIAGLSFKIAAVPFHVWAPDVYEGAPTPVTAFLAVGSKIAGVALLMRVLYSVLMPMSETWVYVIGCLAAITMIFGNLAAIPQKNLKRLLAYAGIGSAGYIFMALAAASKLGAASIMFYLVTHLFSTLGVFLVIVVVANVMGSDRIEAFNGLARKEPYLAATMFLGLLSLAGVPPLGGFIGKFYLLAAIIEQKQYWLAFIGAIMATVTLYYFMLVVKAMYMREPKDDSTVIVGIPVKIGITACNFGVIYLGVYPGPVTDYVMEITQKVFF